jgi:transcriptional regulator with XRE-family HTH domain
MISKWFELKDKAISLRKKGKSIRDIEKRLKIPRSTLSGWLKNIELSKSQKKALDKKWREALVLARRGSMLWHNQQKLERLKKAELEADNVLNSIKIDKNSLDIALAMLYLGEGTKKGDITSVGNSDPLILKFFVEGIIKNYNFDRNKIKCELHLRADQNQNKIKKYWSTELNIPLCNFLATSFDKRTIGRKTYKDYKGVCIVRFGTVAIQRKLVYLSRKFCKKIIMGG